MIKGTQAYVQTQVTTIGQGEILILLYEGAIKFLNQAKEKIFENDHKEKGRLISRAIDIVNELDAAVNDKVNAELARNLHGLYDICSSRLLEANLRLDVKMIDSVIEILDSLRSSFAAIVDLPEARAAAESIAAKMQHSGTTQNPIKNNPAPQNFGASSKAMARQAYGVRPAQQTAAPASAQAAPVQAAPTAPIQAAPVQAAPTQATVPAPKPLAPVAQIQNPAATTAATTAAAPRPIPATAPLPKVAAPLQSAPVAASALPKSTLGQMPQRPVAPNSPASPAPTLAANLSAPISPASSVPPVATAPQNQTDIDVDTSLIPKGSPPSTFLQRQLTAKNLYGKIANS